jgi:hypothetical protein
MAVVLREGSLEEISAEIERLLSIDDAYSEEFDRVDIGPWAAIHVYLRQPEQSTISPPYMEAFLELQRQVYQLGALGISGDADIAKLSDSDRRELEISVKVTGGSSNLAADLKKPLENLIAKVIGKMTKKQLTITIVILAGMLGTAWGVREWLEHTRRTQLEDLRSKDHLAALEKLAFAGQDQSQVVGRLIDVLESQGEFGKRALDVVHATNEGLLRAITKEGPAAINGVEVDRHQAELLRTPSRKKADQVPVKKAVRVVSINTADLLDLQVVLEDMETKAQYRVRFKDNLFAGLDRHKLFESLENRTSFVAELSIREVDGIIRNVEFLRIEASTN